MFLKRFSIGLLAVALCQWGWTQLYHGTEILLGYSSKTVCSNYFISGFNRSESIRLETDAIPQLGTLATIEIDPEEQRVTSSALGYSRTAYYTGRYGCSLAPPH